MNNEIKKKPLKRRTISLEEKLQILNRLKNGERCSSVAKSLNLNEATIRTIRQSENKIRQNLTEGSSLIVKRAARTRNIDIIRMEHALVMWIDDCFDKTKPLNGRLIKEKALEIYNNLSGDQQQQQPSTKLFSASKGWYEKFKKRYLLDGSKLQDETISPKIENKDDYSTELVQIIKSEEFDHDEDEEDIFNTNDSSNYMPTNQDPFLIGNSFEDQKPTDTTSGLTFDDIKTGIELAEKLEFHFIQKDPSVVRSRKFKRELQNCLAPYLEVLEELQNNR